VFVVGCGDDESGTPGGGAGGSGGVGGATGGMGGSGGMAGMGVTGGVGGVTGGMGGSGGMITGGMGGSGGTGGDGSVVDPDEDSGVVDPDEDGGADEPDAEVDAGNTGEEGAQNGPCGAGNACDDGLGCYGPDDSLPNFCTLECNDDEDCEGLSGATWTCFVNGGLCRVECVPSNGNADCPDGFECADVLGNDRCIPMD
jgi:hypothetical protein